MSDESLLPFLSQFDPPQRAEGSIDPLGLYAIADAMGVLLAPGVRERQSKPRFLTLALAGMAACSDEIVDLGEKKGLPAWLVYEWIVVESLVRQWHGQPQLQGIPGRDKVQSTIDAEDVVCNRTYLKSPTVFGFHGIYRVLGTKTGMFDSEGRPLAQGFRILEAWQADQHLAGFVSGTGPGLELRQAIAATVKRGIEAGHARDPGAGVRQQIAAHLNPHQPGTAEATALWDAITRNEALRGEYARQLVSEQGQTAWNAADGSEARYQEWLLGVATLPMQQLLKGIRAFERLARLLTDAFEEALWHMTEARGPVEAQALGKGEATKRAAGDAARAFTDATVELGTIDPALRMRAERALAWIGEVREPATFAARLLEHHAQVQGRKPPNGKRPWIDVLGDGRVAVRPGYTRDGFEAKAGEYVHAYRTRPLWSFALDLKRATISTNGR